MKQKPRKYMYQICVCYKKSLGICTEGFIFDLNGLLFERRIEQLQMHYAFIGFSSVFLKKDTHIMCKL